ncbi:MAG: polyphosphate kinase 1 [Gemmatimonadaceae bacterium]|nr:polyphosphate kinase 1 [Gemmatimonadaceae bacterium]
MATDPSLFINRELSWLEFNARVLHEAFDGRNPLLERLKFLAIFSTNLDEFYMVRVAGLRRQLAAGMHAPTADGMTSQAQLSAIKARVSELIALGRSCLHDELLPALAEHGVRLVTMSELSKEECQRIEEFFESQVFPVLTPLAVDPSHPFPYISNLSLSLAVELRNPDNGAEEFARVKVPRSLARWIPTGVKHRFVALEQVIAGNLSALFPGMDVVGSNVFRVTRYSDLELSHAEEPEDLMALIEEQVFRRRFAEVVRVEIETGTPASLQALLLDELKDDQEDDLPSLPDIELVETGPLLELGDLMTLAILEIPELRDPPFTPAVPRELRDATRSIFDIIREKDILVHHPFDSFSASVEQFITSAALDENVLAIKMTLYRTSGDTAIVRALTEAAERGKQVVVLIELQARFDEVNNITFARTLESFGVHVAYGLAGLKTHTKTALVVRREGDGIRRYAHVGSGNYNSMTARTYTDIGLFTSNPSIGADLSDLFNALTGFSRQRVYRKLIVAPAGMRQRFLELIRRETEHATEGRGGRIIVKMNALVDAETIEALYRASRSGVEIDLIVRGICCLRPGVAGVSDRIRVVSIIGRFLEHSRIFYFANAGKEEYYFGSADWMPRNFDRRVEAVTPVEDASLHPRLRSLLNTCLGDNRQAWDLQPDGSYVQRDPHGAPERATHKILLRNSWGLTGSDDARKAGAEEALVAQPNVS